MSTWSGHKAKFVRRFADVRAEAEKGVTGFIGAVRERTFPDPKRESYEMDKAEWDLLLKLENDEGWGTEELKSAE
jgi:3-methyl-2-oxobutanoate hydroxymethyltransferase